MRLTSSLGALLIAYLHSQSALADRNATVDDLDVSVILTPLRAWGWSNEGHGENGGTFSFSNTENATVTFTSTQNATAVFWQGFKRSGPALYSVCLDCTDTSQAQLVDGHDPDQRSTDSVDILFSSTGLANTYHTLTIKNLLDPRFGFPSQITLDAFILTIPESSSSSVSESTTTTAATEPPATMSKPGGPSPTTIAYWSKASSTATLSTGAVVGIAFAGAIAMFGVVGLGWWLLRRRRAYGKVSEAGYKQDNEKRTGEESPMSSTLHVPPRNAEQAAMFGSTKSQPPPRHDSPRAPSIRSALSSLLSRTPSTQSASSRSEWGTIRVGLSNPFASPHDADAETNSEWDFDTPLPSSTLGSTFDERTPTSTSDRGWRRVEFGQPSHPSVHAWDQRTPSPLI